MELSAFNIYIIVIIVWFIFNFLKKRREIAARKKRMEENYSRNRSANDSKSSDDDALRRLRELVNGENSKNEEQELFRDILSGSYTDDEEEEDEYIETFTNTSSVSREDNSNDYAREKNILLEKQKMYEKLAKTISSLSDKKNTEEYDYSINKRNAISIFKASHEDLRKAIVYNAILERRGKKLK